MAKESWQPSRKRERTFLDDLFAIYDRMVGKSPTKARLLTIPEWLEKYAWAIARRMVTGTMVENARTWRAAACESMRGEDIYEALQDEMRGPIGIRVRELIAENAKLIRSLPQDVASQVASMIATKAQEGKRVESFEDLVPHVFRWKMRLIARTETSKASTALTQARSESLGIWYFEWFTSEDERVRASHRNMQGVICRWDDLPSPEKLIGEKSTLGRYAPGNCPNCRCGPKPLMRYNQVEWPHKVYSHNRIQFVTLAAFRRRAQIEEPLAA